MKYIPPKVDNKNQWVPIVVKNRDYLIGFVNGIHMIKSIVLDSLKNNGINIDLRGIDLCLDSSRFNDIMETGKKESEVSDQEIRNYYNNIISNKIALIKENHPDNNDNIFNGCFLEVECTCGLGIYMFKSPKEIPEAPLKCQVCGKTLIDYTNVNDDDIEYDGNLMKRNNIFVEEMQKTIEKEMENEEVDDDNDDDDFD